MTEEKAKILSLYIALAVVWLAKIVTSVKSGNTDILCLSSDIFVFLLLAGYAGYYYKRK